MYSYHTRKHGVLNTANNTTAVGMRGYEKEPLNHKHAWCLVTARKTETTLDSTYCILLYRLR